MLLSKIFWAGVCAVLAGSYLGALHPLGDSLAVIRIPVACLGLTAVFYWRRHHVAKFTALVSCLILGTVAFDRTRDTGPAGPYGVYQKNLWYANAKLDEVAQDIRNSEVDFVMLQEVSTNNRDLMKSLEPIYPYQHLCPIQGWSGVAVLSKHAIIEDTKTCSKWRAFAAAQVTTPDGPVWVVSQHLFWPYPKLQSRQLERILPKLAALDGPVILAGDFNMQPGTRVERLVAKATRTTALRPVYTTLHISTPRVPVSIDQVLAHCGTVERRPKLGSDHHGLFAQVGFNTATCKP